MKNGNAKRKCRFETLGKLPASHQLLKDQEPEVKNQPLCP